MLMLLEISLSVYIVAWFFVDAHLIDTSRAWLILKTDSSLRYGGFHLLECRGCCAFWAAVVVCLICREPSLILPSWGMGHFLRRLERDS